MQRCAIVLCVILLVWVTSCSHTSGKHRRSSTGTENLSVDNSITIIGQPDLKENGTLSLNYPTDSFYIICRPAPLSNVSEQIIRKTSYIVSYNKNTKIPNWVAWHLTAPHTEGPISRMSNFYEEESVATPRATLEDYRGSGWSRGHMCPAGDNKWDETAMYESFSLVNVCPKNASLNSGLWNSIEIDCRRWAKTFGDVYIVCGPVLLNRDHETIGANKVVVPEAFFKVILCLKGTPKAIGYVVRNNEGKKKRDQFINSVDEVERITGYDFFPALPDDIENEVEAHASIDDWR